MVGMRSLANKRASFETTTTLERKVPETRTKWLPKPGARKAVQDLVCFYGRYADARRGERGDF